jgi:hypothetical protein
MRAFVAANVAASVAALFVVSVAVSAAAVVCADDGFVDDVFIGDVFIGDVFIGDVFIGDVFIGDVFIGDVFISDVFVGDVRGACVCPARCRGTSLCMVFLPAASAAPAGAHRNRRACAAHRRPSRPDDRGRLECRLRDDRTRVR